MVSPCVAVDRDRTTLETDAELLAGEAGLLRRLEAHKSLQQVLVVVLGSLLGLDAYYFSILRKQGEERVSLKFSEVLDQQGALILELLVSEGLLHHLWERLGATPVASKAQVTLRLGFREAALERTSLVAAANCGRCELSLIRIFLCATWRSFWLILMAKLWEVLVILAESISP